MFDFAGNGRTRERDWANEGANNAGWTMGADKGGRTIGGRQWGWTMEGRQWGKDERGRTTKGGREGPNYAGQTMGRTMGWGGRGGYDRPDEGWSRADDG